MGLHVSGGVGVRVRVCVAVGVVECELYATGTVVYDQAAAEQNHSYL